MNVYDAAGEIGYSAYYVRQLVQRGVIAASKVKGAFEIPETEVERLKRLAGPLHQRVFEATCAAPDCGRPFVATTQSHRAFCSEQCQHRTYMRRRRQAVA